MTYCRDDDDDDDELLKTPAWAFKCPWMCNQCRNMQDKISRAGNCFSWFTVSWGHQLDFLFFLPCWGVFLSCKFWWFSSLGQLMKVILAVFAIPAISGHASIARLLEVWSCQPVWSFSFVKVDSCNVNSAHIQVTKNMTTLLHLLHCYIATQLSIEWLSLVLLSFLWITWIIPFTSSSYNTFYSHFKKDFQSSNETMWATLRTPCYWSLGPQVNQNSVA